VTLIIVVWISLLGVLTLQSWTYFLRFPKDSGILKVLVSCIG